MSDEVDVTGEEELAAAGGGDDRVVNTAGREVRVDLGRGSDSYVGGPRKDDVTTGDAVEGARDERDVVRTGAGPDDVGTGTLYGALVDDVDLGAGRDRLAVANRVAGPGARFAGGAASDLVQLSGPLFSEVLPDAPPDPLGGADWVVTNTTTTGTAAADGVVTLTWDGFERFLLSGEAASYRFVGSARDETVEVPFGLTDATLGGGDDVVVTRTSPGSGTLDGGPGRDFADLGACQGSASADLTADTYACDDDATRSSLPGIEDLAVVAQRAVVTGSEAAEKIVVEACRAEVDGLGGDDRLRARRFGDTGYAPPFCRVPIDGLSVLDGGRGDDVLFGRELTDWLIGGRGRDRAYGAGGTDRCGAELQRGCEV